MNDKSPNILHPQYRPDIDGLRAIAVLSVVIFHAFPTILQGGYVGVDIFFVISGFLISSIIFKNLDNQSFNFIDFYARRIRRIFPTLILVLISCYLIGWSALFATEYQLLGKHIAAGAGFISNFILWNENGYFDTDSDLKPLLHLWSLAVEEQFYIIWPVILWITHKWKKSYLKVINLIFFTSFCMNIFQTYSNPILAFYSPINRFWELLMGALLAYLNLYSRNLISENENLKNTASVTGIFFILLAIFVIKKNNLFPGWWAFVPTFGATLLILSGQDAWVNKKILSSKPLVWIGLISFPLYLWHWPLLSFSKLVYGSNLSTSLTIGLVLVSIVLAFITYKYYELPIRSLGAKTAIVLILLMLIIGCAGFSVLQRQGLDFRHYKVLEGFSDKPPHSDQRCLEKFSSLKPDFCNISNNTDHLDTIIIGDSIAHNLYPGVLSQFVKINKGLAMTGWPGRQPWVKLKDDSTYDPIQSEQMNVLLNTFANDDSIDRIILSMNQPKDISLELETQIKRTVDLFRANNKHIIFVYAPPTLTFSPITCFGMPPLRPAINPQCIQTIIELPPEYFYAKEKLGKIFLNLNIPTFDPFEFICTGQECKIRQNSILLYRTPRYLSTQGSEIALKNFPTQW